jgi:uncharacterized protein (PEP-CTERM system associated)
MVPTERTGARRTAFALAAVGILAVVGEAAWGQSVRLTPSVSVRVTATNNAGFAAKDVARSDLILDVAPSLGISLTGANYAVEGTLGFEAVTYAGHEQPTEVFPRARLALRSNPIERLFYLDASFDATTTTGDPFAARIDANSPYAPQAITQYAARINPYLHARPQPNVRFLARSDNDWIRRRNDSGFAAVTDRDARFQRNLVRLERDPVPLGLLAEFTTEDTRYGNQSDAALSLDAARFGANYLVNPQLVLGLVVGREHSVFSLTDEYDSIRGVSLRWTPTERTSLSVLSEKRFFGQGWEAAFTHRSPLLAISGAWRRRPITDPVSLGIAPAGSDLAALLDSIFTTRIPNDADRARAVQDYLQKRNLPSTLTEALEIFGQTARLSEAGSLTLALLGARQLVSFSLFSQRDSNLRREDQASLVVSSDEARQYGGSILYSRQLTPQRTFEAIVTGVATDGQGLRLGDHTRDWSATLMLTEALTPRSNATLGFSRQLVRSNVATSAQETRLFGGLSHRF